MSSNVTGVSFPTLSHYNALSRKKKKKKKNISKGWQQPMALLILAAAARLLRSIEHQTLSLVSHVWLRTTAAATIRPEFGILCRQKINHSHIRSNFPAEYIRPF